MPTGTIENTSGASLLITSLGWGFPTGHTESIDPFSADMHSWFQAISELQALITAGDIVIENRLGNTVGSPDVFAWVNDVDFITSDTDLTDASHYYYGGINPDGSWAINRYVKPGGTNKAVANETGNPLHTTLASAWAVRTSLTYS